MAISISYNDYDTVCYSNQHNIIELIKHSVGISVEINIMGGSIASLEAKVADLSAMASEGHDALLLAQNLNVRLSALEGKVTHIWDNDYTFRTMSELGKLIDAWGTSP